MHCRIQFLVVLLLFSFTQISLSVADSSGSFSFPTGMAYPVSCDDTTWQPIRMPYLDPGVTAYDLSFLLDAPAGKHGFLTVNKSGHFEFTDGTHARFWGVAIQNHIVSPPKEYAESFAANLAKNGCNIVRMHIFDYYIKSALQEEQDGNLTDKSKKLLDNFDYLIYCLKQRGIYVYMDLNDTMSKWWGGKKGTDIWFRSFIDKQKKYARMLLTRVNPYTKNRYVDEPAISHVEILNESSFWWNDNIQDEKEPYKSEFKAKWNKWLVKKYKTQANLEKTWRKKHILISENHDLSEANIPLDSVFTNEEFSRFCYELMCDFYDEMYNFLREDIGVKIPITGHNSPFATPDVKAVSQKTDFVSTHFYGCMSAESELDKGIEDFWTFRSQLAATKVKGKPLLTTEFNFNAPNPYRAESMAILITSMLSQDTDGVIFFNYLAGSGKSSFDKWPDYLWNFRFLPNDPTIWGQFAWGALAFHNRYLPALPHVAEVCYSDQETFQIKRYPTQLSESQKANISDLAANYEWRTALALDEQYYTEMPALFRSSEKRWPYLIFPYFYRVERSFDSNGGVAEMKFTDNSKPLKLDTVKLDSYKPMNISSSASNGSALKWFKNYTKTLNSTVLINATNSLEKKCLSSNQWYRRIDKPYLVIDSPYLQGAVGQWSDADKLSLTDVEISLKTPWASVFVCSLDGKAISKSSSLLLTAVSTAVNTGQTPPVPLKDWDTSPTGLGTGPILFNPVRGEIILKNKEYQVYSINPNTQKVSKKIDINIKSNVVRFSIGIEPSIQYLIIKEIKNK